MEAGRLNEMNTTWRRARSAGPCLANLRFRHSGMQSRGPTRSYDSHIDAKASTNHQVHERCARTY